MFFPTVNSPNSKTWGIQFALCIHGYFQKYFEFTEVVASYL